jgi:hypothetical protein
MKDVLADQNLLTCPTIKPFLTNKGSHITKDIILEDNNKIINDQLQEDFKTPVCLKALFIGGAVTFTLGPWSFLLRRIPDKNNRCAFTRGSREI